MTPNDFEVILPKITDEMWEALNGTSIMTWDKENDRPDWTQDAVDFACFLKIRERAKIPPG